METIGIIGGDLRQLTLYENLLEDGYKVYLYGFSEEHGEQVKIDEILKCNCIILPIPTAVGENVFAPLFTGEIPIKSILPNKNTIVLGGRFSAEFIERLNDIGCGFIDYSVREDLCESNAIPTAEGAIELAMKELPITLNGANALIMGYGRIGKVLAKMLFGIGSNVSVFARRGETQKEIKSCGYGVVTYSTLNQSACKSNVIFNTIPHLILDEKVLSHVDENTLIIDLASKPGGVDFKYAANNNLRVIWALGLPGKVAPISAGIIIYNTIKNIFNEIESEGGM